MDRTDAVDFLAEQWPALAATFGIGAFDSATAGWKVAIDSALAALGVARADRADATVSDGDESKYEALLRYFGARLLYAEASSKVDLSIGGDLSISRRNSSLAEQLSKLMSLYSDDLAALGVSVGDSMTYGTFTLDYLEPATEWAR